jgi:uncharacterized RDD family membrane protein YckC
VLRRLDLQLSSGHLCQSVHGIASESRWVQATCCRETSSRVRLPFMTDGDARIEIQSVNPYEAPSERSEGTLITLVASKAAAAGRAPRLGALIVDGLLTVTPALPGFLFLTLTPGPEDLNVGHWILLASLLSALAVYAYQCRLIAKTGQSLAKRWFRIRIVRTSGEPAGFLHGVVLRYWVFDALCIVPIVWLPLRVADGLAILWASSRTLRDRLADTRVVEASHLVG